MNLGMLGIMSSSIFSDISKSGYFSELEDSIARDFLRDGYVIRPVDDFDLLVKLKGHISSLVCDFLGRECHQTEDLLNEFHLHISASKINEARVSIIKKINSERWLREVYYKLAKPVVDVVVGNELAMQRRVNLSIQMPNDDSSLLAMHADTWSGDSPYEVVAWLPLVDCYKTKSMYIIPAHKLENPIDFLAQPLAQSAEELYRAYEDEVIYLDVPFGSIVVFNQNLPHGNRVNLEASTRWSMNCRFKGIFTPYHDKALGEFFEPITLRPASKVGMNYSRKRER